MDIRPFQPTDQDAVINLWHQCGLTRPWNDPAKDIQRKLTIQPELFLVGEVNGQVMASAMAGYDGHRGSVFYLAVAPEHQKTGYGRQLMQKIEELLIDMGCPKLNIVVRSTNEQVLAFYESLGYELDDVVWLGKRLISDV